MLHPAPPPAPPDASTTPTHHDAGGRAVSRAEWSAVRWMGWWVGWWAAWLATIGLAGWALVVPPAFGLLIALPHAFRWAGVLSALAGAELVWSGMRDLASAASGDAHRRRATRRLALAHAALAWQILGPVPPALRAPLTLATILLAAAAALAWYTAPPRRIRLIQERRRTALPVRNE